MSPPPAFLVEWTKYIALVVSTIVAVRAFLKGATFLDFRIKQLRAEMKSPGAVVR
jgi:hypothetical protein